MELEPVSRARVTRALIRLQQGNFSNVKSVGEGVLEYRIDFGPGYRVYFGRLITSSMRVPVMHALFAVATPSAAVPPAAVGGNPFGSGRQRRGKRQVRQTDTLLFAAVLAHRFEAAIIVHLDRDHLHLDAEDRCAEWQGEILVDHEESTRLLLLVVAMDGGLLNQFVQLPGGRNCAVGVFLLAHWFHFFQAA